MEGAFYAGLINEGWLWEGDGLVDHPNICYQELQATSPLPALPPFSLDRQPARRPLAALPGFANQPGSFGSVQPTMASDDDNDRSIPGEIYLRPFSLSELGDGEFGEGGELGDEDKGEGQDEDDGSDWAAAPPAATWIAGRSPTSGALIANVHGYHLHATPAYAAGNVEHRK